MLHDSETDAVMMMNNIILLSLILKECVSHRRCPKLDILNVV